MSKKIPIDEAKFLANKYDYEQIIILALKKSKKKNWYDGWGTTFNKDNSKCKFLGKIACILSFYFRGFYSNIKRTEEYYKKVNEQSE